MASLGKSPHVFRAAAHPRPQIPCFRASYFHGTASGNAVAWPRFAKADASLACRSCSVANSFQRDQEASSSHPVTCGTGTGLLNLRRSTNSRLTPRSTATMATGAAGTAFAAVQKPCSLCGDQASVRSRTVAAGTGNGDRHCRLPDHWPWGVESRSCHVPACRCTTLLPATGHRSHHHDRLRRHSRRARRHWLGIQACGIAAGIWLVGGDAVLRAPVCALRYQGPALILGGYFP